MSQNQANRHRSEEDEKTRPNMSKPVGRGSKKTAKSSSPNEEIEELRRWDNAFRPNYTGPCLLRATDPATQCNTRRWNHIVGEKFLSVIAPKGKVLYWDIFSGKMLANPMCRFYHASNLSNWSGGFPCS